MVRTATYVLMLPLLTALFAGCTSHDDPVLRLAFTQPDDSLEPAKRPQRLAEALEAATGRQTRLYLVPSTEVALQAVASGQADVAFVDAAAGWIAWQKLDLQAVAAHLESDGRTHYVASAWVRADAPFETMADLRGATSCHTGLLKSAGTFMPLGWLIREGLVERVGPDEITSIEPTLKAFFGTPRIPPSDADPYGNYQGALRCLSDGLGDVAFVKDTTPATFCGPNAANRAAWCLDLGDYRKIEDFGRVPSHPVMTGALPEAKRADLVAGLEGLSATDEGQEILRSVLGTRGVVPVASTEAHLGEYADIVQYVPGMRAHVQSGLAK